jgi:NAD(P)-dependent dehydrogenase (short-subunit alcohol dehydrogenase family)
MPTPIADDQLFVHAKRAKGKVVVITGASRSTLFFFSFRRGLNRLTHSLSHPIAGAASGIGREAALAFAKHG